MDTTYQAKVSYFHQIVCAQQAVSCSKIHVNEPLLLSATRREEEGEIVRAYAGKGGGARRVSANSMHMKTDSAS